MFSKLDNFSQFLFQGNPGLVDTDLKKKKLLNIFFTPSKSLVSLHVQNYDIRVKWFILDSVACY